MGLVLLTERDGEWWVFLILCDKDFINMLSKGGFTTLYMPNFSLSQGGSVLGDKRERPMGKLLKKSVGFWYKDKRVDNKSTNKEGT